MHIWNIENSPVKALSAEELTREKEVVEGDLQDTIDAEGRHNQLAVASPKLQPTKQESSTSNSQDKQTNIPPAVWKGQQP